MYQNRKNETHISQKQGIRVHVQFAWNVSCIVDTDDTISEETKDDGM